MSSRLHKPTVHPKRWQTRKDGFGLPFPNFALGSTEIPTVCRCIYDGTNFYVTNRLDMHTLHYNGSFGTSSLTFRGLSYDDDSFTYKPYYLKKMKEMQEKEGLNGGVVGSHLKYCKSVNSKRLRVDQEPTNLFPDNSCVQKPSSPIPDKVIALEQEVKNGRQRTLSEMSTDEQYLEDKDINQNEDLERNGSKCSLLQRPINLDEERLILMPEEAIFLSFGIGCLSIHNVKGEVMDYRHCWNRLVSTDPDFPALYAAYHYFRGKNWVPKDGNNYGAPYVLYQVGPKINHSTYIVHIVCPNKPKPSWKDLAAWQRLATHFSKNVLLCEVSVPKTFRPEISDPRSVFDMTLKEMSFARWLPQVHC